MSTRPVETAPSWGDVEDAVGALARLDVFRDISEDERAALTAVALLERHEQDRVIPRAEPGSAEASYYFVVKGQVAFAEFVRGTVPEPPASKKKRVPPTMTQTKKHLALFDVGDFFGNDHVAAVRSDDGEKVDTALFTCVPVTLLRIPKSDLDAILVGAPKVKDLIELRAEESYYRQSFLKLDGRGDVFDFYVREGFEYARAIKVIQIDKCIDCDECVKACEDRHGITRIERFGPQLGLIQFTLNCRTCHDARCLDPCNFDAIGFDEDEQEVIVYDNCVGCTLCAKACPHEAIRMVDIVEPETEAPDLVELARRAQERPGTVVAADEPKKKKKPKRIANKCDHCLGYSDMACITACPTAAIIQIDPRALFRRDGGYLERAEQYFDPAPFEQGYARVAKLQGEGLMRALFALTGLAVLGFTWEHFARRIEPGLSLWRPLLALIDGADVAERAVLGWSAAVGVGRWLGYAGAVMMIVSALYTLRLHVPGLRRLGSSKTWFDFHVVFGLAGPVLGLLHMSFKIFETYWVTLLVWWPVFLVVLSGVVGRFIYTAIPRAELATDKDKKALDRGIQDVADQWSSMTVSANVLQQFLKAQEKHEELSEPKSGLGLVAFLRELAIGEIRRIRGAKALRTRLMGQMKNERLRATAIKLMARRATVERRTEMLGVARRLLTQWRAYHIGVSILMLIALLAHIALSIYATGL
jgi:Fe-S-cluster-containing hydrogenase component 2